MVAAPLESPRRWPLPIAEVSNLWIIEEDDVKKDGPGVIVTGYVKVAAKDLETFVEVLQAHVPRVREKDGCIAYSFASDVLDPNVVRMSEAWRDEEALQSHVASDEFQGTLQQLSGVEILARSVQKYEIASTTDI